MIVHKYVRWWTLLSKQKPKHPFILYFGKDIPKENGRVHGGAVKLQRLQQHFPVDMRSSNILYLVSSSLPLGSNVLVRAARRRNAKLVWNQNGVSYPASSPYQWKKINNVLSTHVHQSDYVIYQSRFCKQSADVFLGKFYGPSTVIYNCVDTDFFKPPHSRPPRPLTILLGGNQYKRYRVITALETLKELKKEVPDSKLIITGKVKWANQKTRTCLQEIRDTARSMGILNDITFTGVYSQQQAPTVFSQADVLLHTKWNDPCPGLVIEGLSCGLPVVYSDSGGLPELVSEDCGYAVKSSGTWEQFEPPPPFYLSQGIIRVFEDLNSFSINARKRALERFTISSFLAEHRSIFQNLIS